VHTDPSNSTQIDLWKISVSNPDPTLEYLAALLSSDETDRANRFVFEGDRINFIRVRGMLRIILGRYLQIPPGLVELRYGHGGKPQVDGLNPYRLCFNVSHSAEIALIAVGFGRDLGVDVEWIRRGIDEREIATHFFSPREIQELSSLPGEQLTVGFFNCWTRKEAFVKALGTGLSFPLTAFDVSLRPGEPAAVTRIDRGPGEQMQWTLRDVSPGGDYAAALAVEGEAEVTIVWRSIAENFESALP